jgi:chromosome segregation protein
VNLPLSLQESRLKLTYLEEGIRNKYQTEISSVTAEILNDIPPEEEREKVLDELRTKLDSMGDLNLAALDEYKEVSKRHEEMTAQKDDLSQSMENLNSIIRKLNESYREKFSETFNKVNTKLGRFSPGFPGWPCRIKDNPKRGPAGMRGGNCGPTTR